MSEDDPYAGSAERLKQEYQRATAIEAKIKAKQPAGRKGCPFCGHPDIQTVVRPAIRNETQTPMIPTSPESGPGWPVTLMRCANCSFVMHFFEDDNVLPEGL